MSISTLLRRGWELLMEDEYPDVPDSADLDGEESEDESPTPPSPLPEPGINCRWIEITARCRVPKNDSENWPSGCDAMCPARLQNEARAEQRTIENMRFYQ